MAAAPNTPILKSQRKPKDFRNPTIKTDRRLTRNSSYVAELCRRVRQYADPLEDAAVELSDAEAAMLDGLRLPVYGTDDGAALRDILFTRWEQRFSAPQIAGRRRSAIGSRDAVRVDHRLLARSSLSGYGLRLRTAPVDANVNPLTPLP